MTAIEELRHMLDERGVEWREPVQMEGSIVTRWNSDGVSWTASMVHGRNNALRIGANTVTPEQAIAATLGPRKQPPYDELIEALRRDWDIEASWDGLRRFWYVGLTDEGVRKRDEREATLGSGTCQLKQASWDDGTCTWGCICTACDAHLEHETGYGYNFCPICGAKVVDE